MFSIVHLETEKYKERCRQRNVLLV